MSNADLDAEQAATEQEAAKGKKALSDSIQRRQADDRSFIAKVVVFAFVGLVAWLALAATIGTMFFGWDTSGPSATLLENVLGSVMLPVVTLVIGYYFSTNR